MMKAVMVLVAAVAAAVAHFVLVAAEVTHRPDHPKQAALAEIQ